MSGALDGIRVVDLTTRSAEIAGKTLADLGAEVIKVEPPGGCDARTTPPFAADGRSLFWEAMGLGKHSVVCDIDTFDGQAELRALVASADVLLEVVRPPATWPSGTSAPTTWPPSIPLWCTCR